MNRHPRLVPNRGVRVLAAATAVTALVLAGCAQTGSNGTAAAQSAKTRPNVLLIVADDLGYSDLGAFGGEIPTPHLDKLAGEGRLLTSHYVAPTCSPTRAMLMSGTDNHLAGLGSMGEVIPRMPELRGKPGYEGHLNDRVLALPELLRDAGYHTYMAGKWHLGLTPETGPMARGFEASFALLEGGASHFAPVPGKPIDADRGTYTENGQKVGLPADFYSSTGFTDKLISYIDRNLGDGKPFFAYAAYSAPHWPLHAPDEDIAKFAGRYDAGYEAIRAQRIAKQKALGLLPADFQPNPGLAVSKDFPSWEMLTPEQRRMEARKMEVYAAMVHNMDRNIGRLIQYLKDKGQYENTLIVFQSDNGAEPSPSFFRNNENTDNSLANLGRRLSNFGYGPRWAEVSATPFRLFKGWTTEGGVISPTIVRLPGQKASLPQLAQMTHVSDVAPTILDLAGVAVPDKEYKGRPVHAMTGTSLLPALRQTQPSPELAQRRLSGELFGGRYVREGNWKLVSVMTPFADNGWELYDLGTDRGESRNLASSQPEQVQRLSREWDEYAKRTGVVFAPMKMMPDVRFGAEGRGTAHKGTATAAAGGAK